ncbi:hypothetical protein GGI42DRAFT_127913 [Trichoderma sp. SZMC 28013]
MICPHQISNFFISPQKQLGRQCPHRHRHRHQKHQTVHVPCKQLVMSIISQRRDWASAMQNSSLECPLWSASLCRCCCAPFRFSRRTRRDASPPANRRRPRQQNSCGQGCFEGKSHSQKKKERKKAVDRGETRRFPQRPAPEGRSAFEQRPRRSCSFAYAMLMQLVQFESFFLLRPRLLAICCVCEFVALAQLRVSVLPLTRCPSTTTTPSHRRLKRVERFVLSSSVSLSLASSSCCYCCYCCCFATIPTTKTHQPHHPIACLPLLFQAPSCVRVCICICISSALRCP